MKKTKKKNTEAAAVKAAVELVRAVCKPGVLHAEAQVACDKANKAAPSLGACVYRYDEWDVEFGIERGGDHFIVSIARVDMSVLK